MFEKPSFINRSNKKKNEYRVVGARSNIDRIEKYIDLHNRTDDVEIKRVLSAHVVKLIDEEDELRKSVVITFEKD